MKRLNYNKTLLITVAFLFVFYSLALILFLNKNSSIASSEQIFNRPTNAIKADTKDNDLFTSETFYIKNGAAVRVVSSGIKFVTYVSVDFHNELAKDGATVTYFATAKKVGGTTELTKEIPFPSAPNSDGYYALNTHINFLNIETNPIDTIREYYANEYTTSTFAKVVSSDGNLTTYYQAYSAENDGEYDIVRSMRAVGYSAFVNWTENSYYNKSDVEKYFNQEIFSNDITAYALDSGKIVFKMPDYSFSGDLDVYVGARKFTAVYDEKRDALTINDCYEKANYLSIFTEDSNVYTTRITSAKEITSESDLINLRSQTLVADNYVLTSNITCANPLSASETEFSGIFDGMGYVINASFNDEISTSGQGLFKSLVDGALVKNLNVVATDLAKNSGVIASNSTGNVNIENVVIDLAKVPLGSAPILGKNNGVVNVKNALIFIRDMSEQENSGNGSKFVWDNSGSVVTDNVHVAVKTIFDNEQVTRYTSNDENLSGTIYSYKFFGELCNAIYKDKIKLPLGIKNTVFETVNVKLLNNKNFYDFYNITSGDVILTEDITKELVWNKSATDTNLTFDGAGHTIYDIKICNTVGRGFFTKIEGNSYIVNTNFKITSLGETRQGLIGQNLGNTTLYNVIIQSNANITKYSGLVAATCKAPIIMKECAVLYENTGGLSSDAGILCASVSKENTSVTLDGVLIFNNCIADTLIYSSSSNIPAIPSVKDKDYLVYKGANLGVIVVSENYSVTLKSAIKMAQEFYSNN